jgi:tight adherence protein C
MVDFVAVIVAVAVLLLTYTAARSWRVRQRALARLYEDEPRAAEILEPSIPERWLTHWLSLAGFRRPAATALFVTMTAVCIGIGLALGQFYRVTLLGSLVAMVSSVPGGAGDLFAAILGAGHWILLVVVGLVPMVVVRTARRARVRAIEQDLPLVLELFATITEAGLAFDAAIAKVVRAQGSNRPLISEFVTFQYDMLAGVPRTQALRQLARRADVASLTSFTSALVQAEEVGASMADTLRHQADDLRQRRREDALLKAQALPVKLVFPLVICFLPGIFLSTLAPVIYQMIQVANGVLRSGR